MFSYSLLAVKGYLPNKILFTKPGWSLPGERYTDFRVDFDQAGISPQNLETSAINAGLSCDHHYGTTTNGQSYLAFTIISGEGLRPRLQTSLHPKVLARLIKNDEIPATGPFSKTPPGPYLLEVHWLLHSVIVGNVSYGLFRKFLKQP